MKLPETISGYLLNDNSLNIIHHQSDFTGTANKNMADLTVDNVSKEYQDYLADNNSENRTYPGGQLQHWQLLHITENSIRVRMQLSKQIMASEQAIVSYIGGVALHI